MANEGGPFRFVNELHAGYRDVRPAPEDLIVIVQQKRPCDPHYSGDKFHLDRWNLLIALCLH